MLENELAMRGWCTVAVHHVLCSIPILYVFLMSFCTSWNDLSPWSGGKIRGVESVITIRLFFFSIYNQHEHEGIRLFRISDNNISNVNESLALLPLPLLFHRIGTRAPKFFSSMCRSRSTRFKLLSIMIFRYVCQWLRY